MNGADFAAHLAAVARLNDAEDRRGTRLLGAIVLEWSQLRASQDPTFYLDGASLVVAGCDVALPAPQREALRTLEAALRAHACGGARVVGSIDRNTVIALHKTARASTAPGPKADLQRAFERNGGTGLEFLPPLGAGARGEPETWAAWTALIGGADRTYALQTIISRLEQGSDPLARALATLPDRPAFAGDGVAGRALILGRHLGLTRGPLFDLATSAFALEGPWDVSTLRRLDRNAARVLVATATEPRTSRREGDRPHLFTRILALVRELDQTIRDDGPRRLTPHGAMSHLQVNAGRRHEPALVAALTGAFGEWPIGTTILLSSGEVGVVHSNAAHAGQINRPVVRIVVDRAGAWTSTLETIDLSLPAWERTQIVESLDPTAIGLDLARALAPA